MKSFHQRIGKSMAQIQTCPCCYRTMAAGTKRTRKKLKVQALLTIDHIVMKSQGGTDDPENFRPMCQQCNSALARFGQCVAALRCYIIVSRHSAWAGSPLIERKTK